MARYLLVLVDLAESPALVESATAISAADSDAEFVLLVPATPVSAIDCLMTPHVTAAQTARRRAQAARGELEAAGIKLEATRLGNMDPAVAVGDALRYARYSAVLVACTPRPLMHRLQRDLAARLARKFAPSRIIEVTRPAPDLARAYR